ncbi:hypothetical protein BKA62DRAFT_685517 [Auriculariales sp. MPI-PUGE-AT-0066]|nr:hypothetical protein BKA62DRAFT_685517 [Auriculariales sp. MPI-PUGE-AT-0066]
MGVLYERLQSSPVVRDGGNGLSNVVWLPILAVFGVIVLVSIGIWYRRRVQADVQAVGTTQTTTSPAAQVAAQHAARRRRNRRRASQISTKSLPAYMEEAGDEEVVLVSRSLEPLTTVTEGITRPSMDSGETMPEEHVGTPLLERDPRSMIMANTSTSTAQLDSGSSAHFPDAELSHIRGEAPPYFEVISADDHTRSQTSAPVSTPPVPAEQPAQSPDSPEQNHNRRQSMFRSFFSRHGEQTSPTSSENQSSSQHRPSSSLTSMRTLSLYRSRSNETMQSSTIPLRNISSPIAHTLVRTEFQFPKNGPTEQQLKFLASRESLGRFGVPYGDEARADPPSFNVVIASASSASLLDTIHNRNASLSSSVVLPAADGDDRPSTSSANLRTGDSSPPESPSADIAVQPMPAVSADELLQLNPAQTDTTATGSPSLSITPVRAPRRLSTIQSAIEAPEPSPTVAAILHAEPQVLATAPKRASLTV